MKALVAIRALAVVVAVASVVVSLVSTGGTKSRARELVRIAGVTGLGAQLGLSGWAVASHRGPWTRVLLPLAGIVLAARAFASGNAATLVPVLAVDAAIGVFVLVAVLRTVRRARPVEPEDVLEREFGRFASGAFCRYMAVEIVTFVEAIRYCCGGFRRPLPAGFSYVREWVDAPIVLAAPILFVLPEMLAIDVALGRAPWYWRAGSDVMHAYAALWLIGIVAMARARPHRCDGGVARFRFAGLRRFDVRLDAIASVAVHPRIVSARSLRAPGTAVMALSGSPAVELRLSPPVSRPRRFGGVAAIDRLVVAADDPRALAAALRPANTK